MAKKSKPAGTVLEAAHPGPEATTEDVLAEIPSATMDAIRETVEVLADPVAMSAVAADKRNPDRGRPLATIKNDLGL